MRISIFRSSTTRGKMFYACLSFANFDPAYKAGTMPTVMFHRTLMTKQIDRSRFNLQFGLRYPSINGFFGRKVVKLCREGGRNSASSILEYSANCFAL